VAYALEVHRRARRAIERLSRASPDDYDRIAAAIDGLADNPRPARASKLRGRAPLWRLRVGDYRIVYNVFDPDLLVTIEDILRRTTTTYKDR
jgi:mRNA interferase RelE/StbE